MDMLLDTHNSDLKSELCGVMEEENDRTTSGVVDKPNLVGVEYNGENADIKSQIEEKLLDFLYDKGIYSTFVERLDDGVMVFEKSEKGNTYIDFNYDKEDNNKHGEEKTLILVNGIKELLKEFFDNLGIKIFSGKLQFGFNNGQVVLNGININTLELGDHLVLRGEDGKSYMDKDYPIDELDNIGGKDSSYWRKLGIKPENIAVKRIIAWKAFSENRIKELFVNIVEKKKNDIVQTVEENTERVQRLVFNHGPKWQQDNWKLVKNWKT